MINKTELLEAIYSIAEEKKIPKEIILEGIREGFQKAYERFFDPEAIVIVDIDENNGTIKVFRQLKVVQKVDDEWTEIALSEAKTKFGNSVTIDDLVQEEVDFDEKFSRLAIIQVGNIIKQKNREAEKTKVFEEFQDRVGELLLGTVVDITDSAYLIESEGAIASLWFKRVIGNERFFIGDKIEYVILELSRENRFAQIIASRSDNQFLIQQFNLEVPELTEGEIEIVNVSRDPGRRAKVAVRSFDYNIDPIGSMIGAQGKRVKNVSNKLNGEKIDLVKYDEDPGIYLQNAMSPVYVISYSFSEENQVVDVIVPDTQLSLAIGKSGSAARLVAKLLNVKLNVTSLSNAKEAGMEVLWNGNINEADATNPDFFDRARNNRPQNNTSSIVDNFINSYNSEPSYSSNRTSKKSNNNSKNNYDNDLDETYNLDDLYNDDLALDDIEANRAAFDQLAQDDDEATIDENLYDDYDELYDK